MPPQARFSKQEIVNEALAIIEEEGISNLTSRNLSKRLKSSVCPIFTVFTSMEEVKASAYKEAKGIYRLYIEEGLRSPIPFLGVGKAYIRFAREKSRLFSLLFMNEREEVKDLKTTLPSLDDSYEDILRSIEEPYALKREEARNIYSHLFVYAHGLACLLANKTCSFSEEEEETMMEEVFLSLLEKEREKR